MDFPLKIDGLAELEAVFQQLGGQATTHIASGALYSTGQDIMRQSKEMLTAAGHIDTGNLRASGHVELPVIEGNVTTVKLGYGGPAARYAYYVHEGVGPRAGHDEITITAKSKKVLAVPVQHYKGTPNNYGEGFPMLSKDGNFVLLGRTVHNPGFKGTHYLSEPVEKNIPAVKENIRRELLKEVQERLR